jgi:ABC-2 type transport system permease protein
MSAYALTDSATMLRRDLRHALRYPGLTISTIATPVLILLLFNYAFGGAIGAGLGGGSYIDYIAPGIILMAATSGAVGTAVAVSTDMTEGIVNRFRTMAISRASVLTGHVVGSVIITMASIFVVIAIALAIGFRPTADVGEWIAAIGLLALVTFALTWLSAALGVRAKSVEAASNAPMPLVFLPFISSAIVTTDSMPDGMRQFAENQPFTPIIDTLRGLLMGTEIGDSWIWAIAWSVAIALAGYLWARATFAREPIA